MGIIRKIWDYISCKDYAYPGGAELLARKEDQWKRETTMHHERLVEEHLRLKAYLIAEKDGFSKDPAVYWEEAQRV